MTTNIKSWAPAIKQLLNKGKHDMVLFEYTVRDPKGDVPKWAREFRFDAISFNPFRISTDAVIRVLETKSSRADFLCDKKWQHYLPYAHFFAFLCPTDVIKKDELPKGVGLFYIDDKNKITKIKQWSKREVSAEHRIAVSYRLYARAVADLYNQSKKAMISI